MLNSNKIYSIIISAFLVILFYNKTANCWELHPLNFVTIPHDHRIAYNFEFGYNDNDEEFFNQNFDLNFALNKFSFGLKIPTLIFSNESDQFIAGNVKMDGVAWYDFHFFSGFDISIGGGFDLYFPTAGEISNHDNFYKTVTSIEPDLFNPQLYFGLYPKISVDILVWIFSLKSTMGLGIGFFENNNYRLRFIYGASLAANIIQYLSLILEFTGYSYFDQTQTNDKNEEKNLYITVGTRSQIAYGFDIGILFRTPLIQEIEQSSPMNFFCGFQISWQYPGLY